MLLNRCVNPEDEEGPGDIFQIQHNLQTLLTEYVILWINISQLLINKTILH